jgi:glycosyltransferase involved in cell wall biosynthesis
MRITLYIPACNAARTLPEVLRAAKRQTRSADRLLVVDDGSTDHTAAVARRFGADVLQHDVNKGLAAARNTALEACDTELLAGIDADVAIDRSYVEAVVDAFESSAETAAICGHLTERFTDDLPDRWRAVHMAQHYGIADVDEPRFLFGATTTIRTAVARELGGWNTRYRRNGEDVDLSARLHRAGQRTRYIAGARAEHLRRDDAVSIIPAFWQWFRPAGEDRGDFDSWDTLTRRIEPVTMGIFRHRIEHDRTPEREDLLAITALLPWRMTMLDLALLRERGIATAEDVRRAQHAVAASVLDLSALATSPELAQDLHETLIEAIESDPPRHEPSSEAQRYVEEFRTRLAASWPADDAFARVVHAARRRWSRALDPPDDLIETTAAPGDCLD